MKYYFLTEIIKKVQSSPELKKKVKVFAWLGLVGIVVIGSFTVWAGFRLVSYVATETKQTVLALKNSPSQEAIVSNLNESINRVQVQSCWGQIQSLIAIQPWIHQSIGDNFKKLKVACVGPIKKVDQKELNESVTNTRLSE